MSTTYIMTVMAFVDDLALDGKITDGDYMGFVDTLMGYHRALQLYEQNGGATSRHVRMTRRELVKTNYETLRLFLAHVKHTSGLTVVMHEFGTMRVSE